MKKFFISLLLAFLLGSLSIPANAGSATLSLSSGKTSYQIGDVLKISVNVNSGGNILQVARAKITYPADLLQVQGFTLGSLFPQKSPGESIGGGTIYTGGYCIGDGTSSNGILGTATFKVLKEGQATIALVSGSRLITPEPKDIYSGGNSLTLTLNAIEKPKEEIVQEKLQEQPQGRIILATPVISSNTHPENSWSNINKVNFNWNQPANAQGYVLKLTQDELQDRGNEITTNDNNYTFDNLADGIWTLNLKAKYPNGFSSQTAYYTVKIDTQKPTSPQPIIEYQDDSNGGITYKIYFAATDSLSGTDRYEMKLDDSQFEKTASPYILKTTDQEADSITVKAFDKAGNFQTGTLIIADYIKRQEEAILQAEQGKITLFDIQANAAKRSWLEFYITIAAIAIVFIIIIIWIIVKKRK